jgi:hypothetical protein
MAHGGAHRPASELDAAFARVIAETMQALATASRVISHAVHVPSPRPLPQA